MLVLQQGGCQWIFKKNSSEYDREAAKTRKMFEAIPADADFTSNPTPSPWPWAAWPGMFPI